MKAFEERDIQAVFSECCRIEGWMRDRLESAGIEGLRENNVLSSLSESLNEHIFWTCLYARHGERCQQSEGHAL